MSTNTILATTPLVSTNYLLRATGTTIGNSLIFDNGTNVGINTASPVSTNLVGSQTIVKSYNSDTPVSTTAQTYYTNQSNLYLFGRNAGLSIICPATSEEGSIFFGNSLSVAYASINTGSGTTSVGGDMNFRVGSNTTRMTITSAGNVGIGTMSPNFTLHIDSNTATTRFQITNSTTGQGGSVGFQLLQIANDTTLTNRSNGYMAFETVGTERMRITSGGQVNVNSSQTTYPFYVQCAIGNWATVIENTANGGSGILMRSTGGSQGYYYGAYDGGAYKFFVNGSGVVNSTSTSITIISSDIKLKTDIRDYNKGLAEVLAMKPRIYKRKDNLEIDEVGFIAQEMDIALAGSMIESYKDEEGEPIHTYQLEWYPLLVKAIQELSKQNEELYNRLIKLESK